jgi:hypothetical protein
MHFDFSAPNNIAVFILTFICGLFIAKFIKARGIGGCFTYIVAIFVIILVVSSLVKGYSYFFERITYNLETYIMYNSVGVAGAFVGFIIGLLIFTKR